MQKNKLIVKSLLTMLCLLAILFAGSNAGDGMLVGPARAQLVTGSWTFPINLSQSGSSSNPVVVVDHDGVIHVTWYDEFDGYKVSESPNGVDWSRPSAVDFPFQDFRPRLVSDADRYIYAFWQGDTGELYSSRVISRSFGNVSAWEGAQLLAQSALAYDVALGDDGTLNLAYLRSLDTSDAPAGVYYRQIPSGGNWSSSQLVQTSLYLRGMDIADAHVRIASGTISEGNSVFIAWDERPLKKVFLIRSLNGGFNWDIPLEVDQPNAETGFTMPFDLDVEVWNGTVLLVWETGVPQSNCTIHYQVSGDGGGTWGTRGQVFNDSIGCSIQNDFLTDRPDISILQANISGQIVFLAWNGEQWSDPQIQNDLASLENPITYEYISLGCLQLVDRPSANQILATGCEQSQNGDIWFLSREIGDINDWFPPASAWSKPEELFDVSVDMQSLDLLADLNGYFHAFWTQPTNSDLPEQGSSIFYSQWDGSNWTRPAAILTSPDGEASSPSVALNRDGRLLVAWSSGQIGDLFFSWAQAEQAFSPSEWSQPVNLPSPNSAASSPDLTIGPLGEIYVTYAIPLNEDRGIFYVVSADDGITWSAPVQVFNATLANWDMLQSPHMIVSSHGELNIIWQQQPFPGDSGSHILYYSRFLGDATSDEFTGLAKGWSFPQQIDDGFISWSNIVPLAGGNLQRLWVNTVAQSASLFQQTSTDGGNSWSVTSILGNFGEIVAGVDNYMDLSGQLKLIQLVTSASQQIILRNWTSVGESLVMQDEIPIILGGRDTSLSNIAIATNPAGRLQVVFGVTETNLTNETRAYLSSIHRTIDGDVSGPGVVAPTPIALFTTPTSDITGPLATETSVEPTPQRTPTIALADLPAPSNGPLPGNLVGAVILSAVIAGGLFAFVLLIRADPIKNLFRQVTKNGKGKK